MEWSAHSDKFTILSDSPFMRHKSMPIDFSSPIWKLLIGNVYSDFLWIIVIINFEVMTLGQTFYIDPLFIRLDSGNALWAPMNIGWSVTSGIWVPLGGPNGGRWHATIPLHVTMTGKVGFNEIFL